MRYRHRFFLPVCLILALFSPELLAAASPDNTSTALNEWFGTLNGYLAKIFFVDVWPGKGEMPLVVAWLVAGAIYLTLRMGFVNVRAFRHAIQVIRGRYSRPDDAGEVSPFQALTTALSATVGLGNIAGVAIAVSLGGPGATFWMIVAGLLGMSTKFTEATLAQMYRVVRPDGHIMGGAMEYLSRGLAEKGLGGLGKVMAVLFCVLAIGASLGGGNAFQVNQSLNAVQQNIGFLKTYPWVFGVIMAVLVAVVILGGIRRIARTAEAIVPLMVIIYLLAGSWILIANGDRVLPAFGLIFEQAFTPAAGFGGLIGVLVQGFKRAAFSSEAGIGSAAIAHATAKTPYPVRQGVVALLEPFIDTVVICTMTALVIIVTGVYSDPSLKQLGGSALTSAAFGSQISWFPVILSISVVLFAYSTMISWSYYGERCWTYLFGEQSSMAYRIIFVIFVVVGSMTSAGNILTFSDLMLLAMAFPNMVGLYILSNKVKLALDDYLHRLRSGELDREVGRG